MPGIAEEPHDPLPGPENAGARRLTRSTTEKYVAGVAGGLGRYFGIDPLIFRVAFGAATLVSGVGLLAYIALVAFLPKDDGEPAWIAGRSKLTTIALTGVLGVIAVSTLATPAFLFGPGLFGVAVLTLGGIGLYRAFGGNIKDDPARAIARATLVAIGLAAALGAATAVGFVAAIGGGTAMAIIAIAAGLGLVTAGLLGGPRWLILPVIVFVLPLAVVSAADIDLRGGVGERTYRPATVADLRPEYKLGVGHMIVDLRRVSLPAGTTEVNLRLGMGEARVRVPENACVTTAATIGAGAADLPERVDQGLDINVDHADAAAGRPRLVVKADLGVGHLQVDRSACA
ncbi:MAG TPA: PspC domain-containing protein [Solirubrobacter sp.]|nr:PspC domain-containing protein [Solirubrobacter sp.]